MRLVRLYTFPEVGFHLQRQCVITDITSQNPVRNIKMGETGITERFKSPQKTTLF